MLYNGLWSVTVCGESTLYSFLNEVKWISHVERERDNGPNPNLAVKNLGQQAQGWEKFEDL